MQRTITTVGLAERDTLLIKSYLGLLSGKTREDWRFRDAGAADVCIAASGAAMPRAQLHIRYLSRDEAPTVHDDLCLASPLRVANVIAVLDQASQRLGAAPVAPAATPIHMPAAAAPAQPADTLAEGLRARRGDEAQLWLGRGSTLVCADFAAGRYRSNEPLTAQHATADGWRRLPAQDLALPIEGALTWLMWTAGIAEARVQPGVYRLRRWPDFGVLPHQPSFVRLAAFFARQPATAPAAAAAALVPVPDVEAFLAGCLMAGYAGADDSAPRAAPPTPARSADTGLLGVLGRIRRRLGI